MPAWSNGGTADGMDPIGLLRQDEAHHGLRAPVQAQFWIDGSVDDLSAHVEALGATVVDRPGDRPWGHRDFMVSDPDGNLVWVTRPMPEK